MEQRATLALVLALFAALGSASAQAASGAAPSAAPPPAAAAESQPAATEGAPSAEPSAAEPAEAGPEARGFAPVAIRYGLGVVAALNLDSSSGTASLVTNTFGASLSFPLAPASRLSFEPGADLYWAYYGRTASARAVPIELENRDAFVLALLLDAPLSYAIPISEDFRLSLGAGLALDLRVGFKAAEEVADETVAAINSYLWSKGRFLMPSTTIRIEYRLTENFDFGFAARAFWPLFNLWDAEGLNFFDQGIFGGSLVVRQRLR